MPHPVSAPSETTPETEQMLHNIHRQRNAKVDLKGEKRSNAIHASITDPDARLYKKSSGTGAVLCFKGHGLIVQSDLTLADDYAERRAAIDMAHCHSPGSTRQLTPATDKGS
jgi:hypothetical protein